METEPRSPEHVAQVGRQIFKAMAWAAAGLIAIGVAIMFIPGSHVFRLVAGFCAIACGLLVFALGVDARRRSRGSSAA